MTPGSVMFEDVVGVEGGKDERGGVRVVNIVDERRKPAGERSNVTNVCMVERRLRFGGKFAGGGGCAM